MVGIIAEGIFIILRIALRTNGRIKSLKKEGLIKLASNKCSQYRVQRLINLEITVLVRSLKSSNVELVSNWIGDCSSVV